MTEHHTEHDALANRSLIKLQQRMPYVYDIFKLLDVLEPDELEALGKVIELKINREKRND